MPQPLLVTSPTHVLSQAVLQQYGSTAHTQVFTAVAIQPGVAFAVQQSMPDCSLQIPPEQFMLQQSPLVVHVALLGLQAHLLATQLRLQHSALPTQATPVALHIGGVAHLPSWQVVPVQQSVLVLQLPPDAWQHLPMLQLPPQHSLLAPQVACAGLHAHAPPEQYCVQQSVFPEQVSISGLQVTHLPASEHLAPLQQSTLSTQSPPSAAQHFPPAQLPPQHCEPTVQLAPDMPHAWHLPPLQMLEQQFPAAEHASPSSLQVPHLSVFGLQVSPLQQPVAPHAAPSAEHEVHC